MRKSSKSHKRGFTLIELLVVVVIAAVMILIGIPVLRGLLVQAQMVTFSSQLQATFQRARFEAIKQGFPVIVQLQPDSRTVRAYIDIPVLDGAGVRTDTPLALEPVVGLQRVETDRVLFQIDLPKAVVFDSPAAETLVDGMTNLSGGAPSDADLTERVLVFNSNGAVADVGAFRFGDLNQGTNFLEARVEFASSGKSAIRKYDCDDSVWRYKDEEVANKKAWTWYHRFRAAC